jgi:hypothetical protein
MVARIVLATSRMVIDSEGHGSGRTCRAEGRVDGGEREAQVMTRRDSVIPNPGQVGIISVMVTALNLNQLRAVLARESHTAGGPRALGQRN